MRQISETPPGYFHSYGDRKMKDEGRTMEEFTDALEGCRQRMSESEAIEAQRTREVEI